MADGGIMAGAESGEDALRGIRLVDLAETTRFRSLDRMEAYYRCAQDEHKAYDWDGYFLGYGAEADIAPGWFVPYKRRKPSSRYDLAKVIVNRLSSMLFGSDRFPEIRVPGDPEAEDYVKALSDAARLPARMAEARSLGGACGSVCLSWGFVSGRPRVEVHNSKHVTVLRWADQSEWKVGAAIKAFVFPRQVVENGKIKVKDFFFARYWDENVEIVWEPMPREVAQTGRWVDWRHRRIAHAGDSTPFYWVQNHPDSESPDGESDFAGLCDTLDEINQLLSATGRGTKANVDPTLVLRMDPAMNEGTIKRGTDNVIFSPGGAEYLELRGTSTQVALGLVNQLRSYVLDAAGVVLADPEKLSGAAQSAQALRILYAPMLARCDVLREQYSEFAIKPILRDMLRHARTLLTQTREATDPDGNPVVVVSEVVLPAKMVQEGDEVRFQPRTPGSSEELSLNWNPYFSPTWNDIKAATEAVKAANGGKQVISQKTSIASVQTLFGVEDVEAELQAIHEETERETEQATKALSGGAVPSFLPPEPGEAEEEEGEEEAEEDDEGEEDEED